MKARVLLLSGVLVLFLAKAVSAQAASVTTTKSCYGTQGTVDATASGFPPNSTIKVNLTGFTYDFAPRINAKGQNFLKLRHNTVDQSRQRLTVYSEANPALRASTTYRLVKLSVKLGIGDRVDVPVRIKANGFTDDFYKKRGTARYLYFHAFPPRGKPYRVRLGKTSRCGGLNVVKRIFPRKPAKGLWKYRINTAYSNRITEKREPQTYADQIIIR